MISLVLPVFNELHLDYLPRIIDRVQSLQGIELVVVDGGSTDGTLELLESKGIQWIDAPDSNRAQRLNIGIKQSKHDMVLLHHPRSLVETAGYEHLVNNSERYIWGGFTHAFDRDQKSLKFTSYYSNNVRPKVSKVLYLDHCIFFSKSKCSEFEGVKEVDIFEDTFLSKALRKYSRPTILPFVSETSAIRFVSNGFLRQGLMNQVMKAGFELKVPLSLMNRVYEKGLKLNKG